MRPFSRPPALRRRLRTFYSRHTLPARAVPSLRCFRAALPIAPPSTSAGRHTHTHTADARSPCVLAPACYICTPSPKKRFFEGISALFLSEIPLIIVVPTSLQNIYFYKYILSYNNYLYTRKHCTPWRGFSRGWRGVFARALFQGSARAPKRLFVGVFSAPEWPEWPDGWARTEGGAQKRDGKQILRWAGALLRMTERGSK